MSKNNNYYHHHSSNGLLTTSASTPTSTTTPTPTFPNPSPNPMGGGINGFTIIEVALVLAIAGLIFLVVFIAWPALQNSQADTARRQDVGRVVSAIESYKADNQGRISVSSYPQNYDVQIWSPTWNDGKLGAYISKLNDNVDDVWFAPYVWRSYEVIPDGVNILAGRTCPTNGGVTENTDNLYDAQGTYAVLVRLSSGVYFCQNAS